MSSAAVGAPCFLEAGLEDVSLAVLQFVAYPLFVVTEFGPVAVVELLDDLKRPSAVQHVAPNELGPQPTGDLGVAGFGEVVARYPQQHVGVANQLMKGIEVSARPLGELQRFGDLAHRTHRLVIESHAALSGIGCLVYHPLGVPSR